jgi:hypothetical protein
VISENNKQYLKKIKEVHNLRNLSVENKVQQQTFESERIYQKKLLKSDNNNFRRYEIEVYTILNLVSKIS